MSDEFKVNEEVDEFDFDLSLQEIPIKLGGESYTLTEATEGQAKQYRNFLINKARMKKSETVGYGNIGDAQVFLLSMLLSDSNGLKAEPKMLDKLPSRVVKPIFEKAKQISGLDESDDKDETDTEKNS